MKKKNSARKAKALRQSADSDRALERLKTQIFAIREEQRLNRIKLNLIHEIGKLSDAKTKLDQVLGRGMTLALKGLRTESGTLFVLDEDTDELIFQIVKGPKKTAKMLQGQRLKKGEGIVGHVVKTGKPYISENVSKDRHWKKQVSESIGYKTNNIMCVPLRGFRGRIIGAIQVINHAKAVPYTRADLKILESISRHIGVVVENAQLIFTLQGRNRDLNRLHEVNALLTSSLDREEVKKAALKAVVELMQCETGSLYQVDQKTQELFFDVVLSEKEAIVKTIRLRMGEGVAGWVAEHRQSVVIPDCLKDARFSQRVDKAADFITRNMICAPLLFKGEVIGVLQAINRKNATFYEADRILFQDLANQVAVALKNALLFEDLRRTFYESVTALAEAIELRDPYTGGHTQRVRKYSMAIGQQMKANPEQMEILSLSAILHDVGKIGVSDQILRKQGKLDAEEFAQMKKHPELGYQILQKVPSLSMTYDGVLYHHERFDGRGYPKGLKGEDIPMFARIIAVADTFDAMTTNRPYRDGLSLDFVLAEMKNCSGTQFDKRMVAAFFKAYEAQQILSTEKASDFDFEGRNCYAIASFRGR